jgi:hypothetical protein
MDVVSIIGSRDASSGLLKSLRIYIEALPVDTIVVTGSWWDGIDMRMTPTRGVDGYAAMHARRFGLTVVLVGADYDRYKKFAGIRRNPAIIQLGHRVVAFWDGASKGTQNGIEFAEKLGKPCEVIKE